VHARTTRLMTGCLAALGASLALAAGAGAAPILLGAGQKPDLFVDGSGTGHFTWTEQGIPGTSDILHYCQLPRGKTTCDVNLSFTPTAGEELLPTSDFEGPSVFLPSPGRVVLVSHRCCSFTTPNGRLTLVYVSSDGGRSFPAFVGAGSQRINNMVYGPGARISGVSSTVGSGVFFSSIGLTGFTDGIAALGTPDQAYGGDIAMDGTTPVVVFSDRTTTFFRRYTGSGDINLATSWTPIAPVGNGTTPHIASGPSGVYVLNSLGGLNNTQFVVWRLTESGPEGPVPLTPGSDVNFGDLFQDAAGRLHAIWVDASDIVNYRLARNARVWGATSKVTEEGELPNNAIVATGPDGGGWVAWDEGTTVGSVKAVPLAREGDATAEPRSSSRALGSTVVTLSSPGACISPTDPVRMSFSARARRKRQRAAKVRSVVYAIGGAGTATARKAPFAATISIKELRPGTRALITARALLQKGKKRSRTTVKATFEVC